SSYLGVYYNIGSDVSAVLGQAATDQLRMDEREGRAEVPVPTRKPAMTGPAPSLTLTALTERSRGAWTVAHREFTTARPTRGGGTPGYANPPATSSPPAYEPPRIKPDASPSDTLKKSAPPDSAKKHPHTKTKPKPPHAPKPSGESDG